MRFKRLLSILLILTAVTLNLAAQSSESWYLNKPIEDIRFEGLSHVKLSDLKGITQQYVGQTLTEGRLIDLQSKLYALNFFQRFSVDAEEGRNGKNSVVLVLTVTERPIVDEIIIEGNKKVRTGEILDAVQLKRDDIVTTVKIKADEQAIAELYRGKGYPEISVSSGTQLNEATNTMKVTFTVIEGSQVRVQEIRFSGNEFVSSDTLRGKLTSKEQSLFSSGILKEASLQQDRSAIERFYQEQGYIDAKVVNIGREVASVENGRQLMILTFYINEGRQWKFGGITFNGNQLYSDDELGTYIRLEPGDVINYPLLQADLAQVSDLYFNDGYIFNAIVPKENRNEQEGTIDFLLNITEKGRAHIEDVILKGNEKTKDFVLYREIPLETGDVFSKDKVLQAMQNLYNTGLFSAVSPETPYGSAEGLMDLVFTVEEARTTDIQFGITFTGGVSEYPIVGFLQWTDHNFRGAGQELSIGAQVSNSEQSITFSFSDNWLFDKRFSGGVNFSFAHNLYDNVLQDAEGPTFTEEQYDNDEAAPDPYTSREEYEDAIDDGESIDDAYLMEYDQWKISLGANGGYTFHTDYGRVGLQSGLTSSISYVDYDPDLYTPYNPSIRENLHTWLFTNKLWGSINWDTRDYIYSPTRGGLLSETLTYTGGLLFGSTHYIKTQTKAQRFLQLFDIPVGKEWSFRTILAAQSSLSFILPQWYYDSDTGEWTSGVHASDSQLLYTDGMTIARGWDIDKGNEALWDNWVELRIPISEKLLWSDFYFSTTGTWDDLDMFPEMGIEDFKFSMGGGIRLIIPGLPLGLYLVKTFSFDEGGNVQWDGGPIFSDPDDDTKGLKLVLSLTTGLF